MEIGLPHAFKKVCQATNNRKDFWDFQLINKNLTKYATYEKTNTTWLSLFQQPNNCSR